jgi:hypothetical protein
VTALAEVRQPFPLRDLVGSARDGDVRSRVVVGLVESVKTNASNHDDYEEQQSQQPRQHDSRPFEEATSAPPGSFSKPAEQPDEHEHHKKLEDLTDHATSLLTGMTTSPVRVQFACF